MRLKTDRMTIMAKKIYDEMLRNKLIFSIITLSIFKYKSRSLKVRKVMIVMENAD